ncbi:hypothetical protein TDB9533_00369 [Thalassocella blandensis]|nr:hypothetical protein TDB9533_00369 [Thalassocella blandensis]
MATQYLCKKHQRAITNNPQFAKQAWQKFRLSALQFMLKGDWDSALASATSALETADKLLTSPYLTDRHQEIQRFVRTAMDYIFVLRKSSQHTDLQTLVEIFQQRLSKASNNKYSDIHLAKYLTPIQDIAFAPLEEAEYWMSVLYEMEQASQPNVTKH